VIRENRGLIVREVTEEVGIITSSCHTGLTEELEKGDLDAAPLQRLR
jgi:hypothetical protein